ncbi:hypothetical protein [Marmoricola sp. URHB0036]|uniref:hypothetical protein n=1 Tax=Marmoricola sp. URHB0036 TaxID=1298863 RepID=UPI0003F86694|nr:hypothetical protein [Marmoricola sp. URHB0036]
MEAQDLGFVPLVVAVVLACWWGSLQPTVLRRFGAYTVSAVVIVIVAASAATSIFSGTQCGSGEECDIAPVAGLVWGVVSAVLLVVGFAVNETRLIVRRVRSRPAD